ncbi:MAG: glycosyltransferase [Candidatus Eisenbacteria bacterium]
MSGGVRVSILLFCSQSAGSVAEILESLISYVHDRGPDHELIVVLDGHLVGLYARFQERLAGDGQVTLVGLHAQQGQVATIRAGLAVARGQAIVTFPSYPQVDTDAIPPILDALAAGADYVVGYRVGRQGSPFKRLASRMFNGLIHATTGVAFHDLACGIRMRSSVSRAIPNYGDNQLFCRSFSLAKGSA